MNTFIKSGNAKLWIYIVALVLMAALWKAGEAINSKLVTLPIKTAPKSTAPSVKIDQKNFYAVWVKRITSSTKEVIEDDQAVENLFNKKEEPDAKKTLTPEIPPEPDYVQTFKQNAVISGVSDDGIFINGQFVKIGQNIDHLAMAGTHGKSIIPALSSIKNGKVNFTVGKDKVDFLIGKE